VSAWVLAVSAGHLVEQIGSYAGYASIIGLGIMALLYFTQAREVKRLREWAGREPERAAELAQRVQADPARRVVAQPLQPSTAAAQQQATAALYASVGATPPPGVGAPPPGQLARPTPTPVPVPGAVVPGAPSGAPGAPGAPAAIPAVGAAPAVVAAGAPTATPGSPAPASTPQPVPGVPGTATATATPPAATAAAAGAAAASRSPSSAPIYGNGSVNQDTHESAAARPGPLRSLAESDDDADDGEGLSTGRIAAFVVGGIVAVAIAVVVVLSLTGDDSTPTKPNDFGDTPAASSDASRVPGTSTGTASGAGSSSNTLSSAQRRATNVAVLNGTERTGLARSVGDKIGEGKFKIGKVDTNPDQRVPATVVSYAAGKKPAALAVAKIIGLDSASVQPADANATVLAADADVLVIVGADLVEP
jgi:hypothetical protein